jgi:hypothetical protein
MNSLGTIKAGLTGECPEARELAARVMAALTAIARGEEPASHAGPATECSGQNEWTQYTKSRNAILRDQSEDRPALHYHVVCFEHKDFGLVYYVRHPNGGRNSVYTTNYDLAWAWRDVQEAERREFIPQPDILEGT